jgi:hypothetical protein
MMRNTIFKSLVRGISICSLMVGTLVGIAVPVDASEIVVQPNPADGKDAWISSAYTGTTYNDDLLAIGQTVYPGAWAYTLLQFDVSSVNPGASTVKVQLYFSGITSSGCGLSDVSVYAVTSDWSGTAVTWATKPTWSSVALDIFTGTSNQGDIWEWDITSLFNDWKSGAQANYGVAFAADPSNLWGEQGFYSAYSSNPAGYFPKLVITYADISDTQGPIVGNILSGNNPCGVSTQVSVNAIADDSATGNSSIGSSEYNVDGGLWYPLSPVDGTFDEPSENVIGTFNAPNTPGIYNISVRATDCYGNVGDTETVMLVVYDPNGGFVTGGGWFDSPAGALTSNRELIGKANFGFVSKYIKGNSIPTGNTEFQFKVGDFSFRSTSYDWLVVNKASSNAQFKGSGTINGQGDFKFMIWTTDASSDTFRIKIWTEVERIEQTIYDNEVQQAICGGSIVVHAK